MLPNLKGSALISALFIMTLIAIAATAMSSRLQLDIYRTRISISSDKLKLASKAVTFWAFSEVAKNKSIFSAKNDYGKIFDFPERFSKIYPGVTISGELYDLQALFNLNNLKDYKYPKQFILLLENSMPRSNIAQQRALLDNLVYWISPYKPGRGHDEYLKYYSSQLPPLIPSFQPMQSISELRLVRGFSKKVYKKLQPLVTALPKTTPININTAPKIILSTLGNGLNEIDINKIYDARGKSGISDLNDLTILIKELNIPNDQVTIESNYYLSIANASTSELNLKVYTIISRSKDAKGNMAVGIVSESINTM